LLSVTEQVVRALQAHVNSEQTRTRALWAYSPYIYTVRRKYTDGAVIQGPSQSLQLMHPKNYAIASTR